MKDGQAGARQRFPSASTAKKISSRVSLCETTGSWGSWGTSQDVTNGIPFTPGPAAQVGAPETPEHLQHTRTNPPKSPPGDGAALIPQPQGIMASKGRARKDLKPNSKVPKVPWLNGHLFKDLNFNGLLVIDVLSNYQDHSDLQQNQGTDFTFFFSLNE